MSELPITQINFRPGVIDLGMGNPDFDLLPVDLLRQSAETYFSTSDPRPLQYGIEQGDGYFRQSLAGFLSTRYGTGVDPDLLFITAGASSALDLLCTLFTQPGEVIFVEEPTYFLALRIFEDHGLRVVPIPMDADGLRLDVLEQRLTEFNPKFIYIIPVFQNPSGRTLSQDRRQKLVGLAQRENFLVVADEAYQFLAYSQSPPESFAVYTRDVEQIVSVNSFSKILAPGLRLGWIQAHGTVIERLSSSGLLESGGGMNPFTSALVRGLIESGGLDENITNLRRDYSQRLTAMDAALRTYLPTAEYTLPQGGFFFWVNLPGVDAADLRSRAQEFQVDFRQGALFSSQAGMRDYLRLGFCFYDSAAIEEGVKRLGDCIGK
ncbi:MAG: PLP-dependent aminotransferase family protein [Anaerolineales bacterium]|nr:PLP-dependent aminotransferase family protein [Anaerolineales bacterium]